MAIIQTTIQGLRTMASASATDIYYTTDKGQEGFWKCNNNNSGVEKSTTIKDNVGTILTSGWSYPQGGVHPLGPFDGQEVFVFRRIYESSINVAWFGAKGNNNPNDAENNTVAFNNASIVLWGVGGELVIPSGIYYVGSQSNIRPASTVLPDTLFWTGENEARFRYGRTIIDIRDCVDNPVRIKGNGAVLKYRPDMRFGAWQGPINGNMQPYYASPLPSEGAGNVYKSDVGVMINLIKNTRVEIEGVVLDGNIQNQLIGGQWGDNGYQCEHIGIRATGNEQMSLTGLEVRNFGLDGVYLTESLAIYAEIPSWERPLVTVLNCNIHNNGRQAMSVAGGKGLYIANSRFNGTGNTGHSGWVASLGAGIDFETESGVSIEQVEIVNCEFIGNQGAGIILTPLANPITDIKVDKSKFVAVGEKAICFYGITASQSFTDCEFIGYVEAGVTSANLKQSVGKHEVLPRFTRCRFKAAMNNTSSAEAYRNTLLVATACVINDCTFLWSNPNNINSVPQYLVRMFYSLVSNSVLIIRDSNQIPFSAKLAHFYEVEIDKVDVVINAADTAKGWIIEDHCITAAGVTPASQNVTINQVVKRLGTRTYW